MSDSYIQLPTDSTGKKVDTRVESTNSEHREVHVIGDPATNEGVAVVTNVDPTGETYGVVVRDPNTTTIAARVVYGSTTGSGTSTGALRVMLASDSLLSTQTTTDAVASSDYPAVQAMAYGLNGTTWDRAKLANLGSGETQSTTLRIVTATDNVASVIVNSGTVTITGSVASTVATGDTLARTADSGAAPVKVGGIARQTNPTAFADGDRTNFASDDLGRQLMRPVNARDLILTARAALSTGTEATLLAAVAGSFLDLVSINFSNNSTAAVAVDVRAVTAGNIVYTANVAANGYIDWSPPIPWPQDATGNNWTVDMPDITGTTVNISALFSKEV